MEPTAIKSMFGGNATGRGPFLGCSRGRAAFAVHRRQIGSAGQPMTVSASSLHSHLLAIVSTHYTPVVLAPTTLQWGDPNSTMAEPIRCHKAGGMGLQQHPVTHIASKRDSREPPRDRQQRASQRQRQQSSLYGVLYHILKDDSLHLHL